MPEIPRFYSTKQLPAKTGLVPVSPSMMGAEAGAFARAGEGISQLGLQAANVFAIQIERDRRAEEANKAGKVKIGVKNDADIFLENWRNTPDYENSEKDVDEWEKNIREKYAPMSTLKDGRKSKDLSQAIDLSISSIVNDLKKLARDRYREGLTRETKGNWITQKGFYFQDYANATTPEEKAIIRNNFEIEARELVSRQILWPEEAEIDIKTFDKDVDKIAADLDDVKADRAIMYDPAGAFINLHDPKYLPNLSLKVRQDKIEKANAAFKIFQNEQEKKLKEQEKLNHDNDDREIGNLFMKKEFTKAYSMAQQSKYLTGDEKRIWATTIETASKIKEEDIDPVVEAINYDFINELISKEVNPRSIKGYIFSSELKTGTRQKLLDRLDKETDTAINKARDRGYFYMKGQIMPYAGMEAAVPPEQVVQYTKAMNALDDWIDKQRKADKPITSKDIQAKAEELAITFELSIEQRQEIKRREDEKYFEDLMRRIKGKKLEIPPVPTVIPSPPPPSPIEKEPSPDIKSLLPDPKKEKDNIIRDTETGIRYKSDGEKWFEVKGETPPPREKGPGFFGTLRTPKGEFSTELSIGVEIDGKETEIPSLVPTLTKDEVDYLLKGGEPTKKIVNKAIEHAKKRISEGKSPFAQIGEKPTIVKPKETPTELPKEKAKPKVEERPIEKIRATVNVGDRYILVRNIDDVKDVINRLKKLKKNPEEITKLLDDSGINANTFKDEIWSDWTGTKWK